MAVIGPVEDDESVEIKGIIGTKMLNLYRKGITYSNADFKVDDIQIAKMKKKSGEIEEWYLNRFGTLTSRLSISWEKT